MFKILLEIIKDMIKDERIPSTVRNEYFERIMKL